MTREVRAYKYQSNPLLVIQIHKVSELISTGFNSSPLGRGRSFVRHLWKTFFGEAHFAKFTFYSFRLLV